MPLIINTSEIKNELNTTSSDNNDDLINKAKAQEIGQKAFSDISRARWIIAQCCAAAVVLGFVWWVDGFIIF